METLNDADIDWLTNVENRLLTLRKREASNTNRLGDDITTAIKSVDWLRVMLAARLERKVESIEA